MPAKKKTKKKKAVKKKKTKKQEKEKQTPKEEIQKQIRKHHKLIKQDPFLGTISSILKTLAFLILVTGVLSSLFSWGLYSWWLGALAFILIWIIASSMKHW